MKKPDEIKKLYTTCLPQKMDTNMKETYVITRKDEENGVSRTLYFYEWMFGLPRYGENLNHAMKFEHRDDADRHLPSLRKRKTVFGTHYQKGIRVTRIEVHHKDR